jgi:hypothetical protein
MADGKPKRSLFKRPTWAATTITAPPAVSTSPDSTNRPDPTPTDIFSHSHNFSELVEERQRQRQRKKSDKDVLRRSQTSEVKDEESRTGKRRRISNDDASEPSTKPKPKAAERKTSIQASVGSESFAIAPTPQKTRPRKETVIELLDSDDDNEPVSFNNGTHDITPSNATSLEPTPAAEADPDADLDYYSDPEMREFARQARQKRRREEQERAESGAHDPTVKLLITSPLPGTGPLIVSRKLSQNLQAVREAWLSKQPLDPLIASRVFFTYRLRKVYDVTTVRSLGIKVDSYGRIMTSGPFANADDEHAEKIHIEAVTDEAWQELKNQKAARDAPKPNKCLNDLAAADSRHGSTEGTPAVDGEAAVEEPLIKVTLKAKGHSDIKIKVRPVSYYPMSTLYTFRIFLLTIVRRVQLLSR